MSFVTFALVSVGCLARLPLIIAQSPNPNSIAFGSFPGFRDQDSCSQNCLEFGLTSFLQCSTNACLCRSDRQVSGEGFLSTCASSGCNNANDATAVMSIFSAYCSGYSMLIQSAPSTPISGASATGTETAGSGTGAFATLTKTETVLSVSTVIPTVKDVSQIVTTTNAAGQATATTVVTALPVVTQTSTVSGLSQSDKISLGVGLSVGLATFILGLWSYLTRPWEKYLEAWTRKPGDKKSRDKNSIEMNTNSSGNTNSSAVNEET